jgi:hypothetical protein
LGSPWDLLVVIAAATANAPFMLRSKASYAKQVGTLLSLLSIKILTHLVTKAYTISKCSNNNNNTNLLLRALKDTNNSIENSMTPSLNNSNDCVSTIDCNTVVPIVDNVCLKPSGYSDSSLYETDSIALPFKQVRNHQNPDGCVCITSIPNARLGVLLSISTCTPQCKYKHDEKINQWWIDQSVLKKDIKFVQINTYPTWLSFLYKQSFSNKKSIVSTYISYHYSRG